MNLIVIDDFYADPDKVRNIALNAEYRNVQKLNYPGYQTVNAFVSEALKKKLGKLIGKPIEIHMEDVTFGKFRIMLKESTSRLKVHLDRASDWTGVLYLTPQENCQGGTAFYRHRETGLDGPVGDEESKRFGHENWENLEEAIIERDTLRDAAWEETMFVGMKYNRLVLFRGGELFHSHTRSFGQCKESGRMTQNFFFDEAK